VAKLLIPPPHSKGQHTQCCCCFKTKWRSSAIKNRTRIKLLRASINASPYADVIRKEGNDKWMFSACLLKTKTFLNHCAFVLFRDIALRWEIGGSNYTNAPGCSASCGRSKVQKLAADWRIGGDVIWRGVVCKEVQQLSVWLIAHPLTTIYTAFCLHPKST
jgi:hypothetical protein